MLELAILGLLTESPMHGYELRKRLSTTLGAFRALSYGSLYPTLRKLRDAGWISEEQPQLPEPQPPACGAGVGTWAGAKVDATACPGSN